MDDFQKLWWHRAKSAESQANKILASRGYSSSRVVFLSDVKKKLLPAPVDVQEYFEESITCLKSDLTRSAIVVSWSGFFSLFCENLFASKESQLRSARPKWTFADAAELKEENPESQIIVAAKDVKFIKNPKRRMLDGWLSQRNQCAHPTVYRPSMDIAIGFVAAMVDETLALLPKP